MPFTACALLMSASLLMRVCDHNLQDPMHSLGLILLLQSSAGVAAGEIGLTPHRQLQAFVFSHLCCVQVKRRDPLEWISLTDTCRRSSALLTCKGYLQRKAKGQRRYVLALADSPMDAAPRRDLFQDRAKIACACQSLAAMIWSAARKSVSAQLVLTSAAGLLWWLGLAIQANILAASGLEGGHVVWEAVTSGLAAAALSLLLSLVHAVWCHGFVVAAVSLNLHALALTAQAPPAPTTRRGMLPEKTELKSDGVGALLACCRKMEESFAWHSVIAASGALFAAIGALQVMAVVGARCLVQAPVMEFWLTNPALRIQVSKPCRPSI